MELNRRHAWDVTPREAIALQQVLRHEVVVDAPFDLTRMGLVAGVDVSVKRGISRAAVVVAAFPTFEIIETVTAERPTPFPYVPGLLSFREGPVLEEAFERLVHVPDVFVFDGAGIAHPRRIGIAAHMGLWLERPTIGCAKTRLTGTHDAVPLERGAAVPLMDGAEVIGTVLRTRASVAPLFVSAGHRIDTAGAAAVVLACATRYRLPEPVRFAHRAAGAF